MVLYFHGAPVPRTRNGARHANGHRSEAFQASFDKVFIKLLVNRLIDTTAQVGRWDILADGASVRLPTIA